MNGFQHLRQQAIAKTKERLPRAADAISAFYENRAARLSKKGEHSRSLALAVDVLAGFVGVVVLYPVDALFHSTVIDPW